jgi:cell wall-associated NlpC family hydrolase
MSETFDRRLHPVRPDLAAKSYEGRVTADRFVEGAEKRVTADRLDFRKEPRRDSSIDTEALYGEAVRVFEETEEGWAWGQLETDGYVGWFSSDGIGAPGEVTHRVRALRTYRYPGPDLKFPPLGLITIGSRVTVTGAAVTRGLDYARLDDGSFVVARHLVDMHDVEADWVKVAEEFMGTPYLWGGRTSLGLDCSALVQLAAQAGGHSLLRDSDMQEETAGQRIEWNNLESLQRGDLVFWKGHVGIVQGPDRLLHANGHTMTVSSETLSEAAVRIAENEYGEITSVRRLEPV